MAVAQSRGFIETFEGYVAPTKSLSVPNHLLDTKIYSKVAQNELLQTKPSVVHFAGFKVGEKQTKVVKIANASSETQKMHIIPPTSKYFYIKYHKNERLVPGLYIEVTIEFTPDEWRYYYDCIRIHSKAEENLIIPIHAYPVMSSLNFPKDVHFPLVPLGKSKTRVIPLRSDIPVDFEFELNCLQSNPAFSVSPMSGIVPGDGEVNLQVTFKPIDYSTAILKLQLLISQFNAEPLVCTLTGTSQPGLAKKTKEKSNTPEISAFPTKEILDPLLIDPLGRTRIKKLKTKPWIPDDQRPKHISKDGYQIPSSGNINSTHAVSAILSQQQGKLKAKDIREAVQSKKDLVGSSKQMKETVFEYQVHQNVQEERQNQLRWCVRLGENALTDESKHQIQEERQRAEQEYKLGRGDPVVENEFDRSTTGCQTRRVHRQATEVPQHQPQFDMLVNDEWSKRYMVTKTFVQAARKIIIRLRATKNARSLTDFVSGWRKGKFSKDQTRSQIAESEEEKILCRIPTTFNPALVHPFSLPAYKSPDTKDDLDVDALGVLSVQPSGVKVKSHVPFHNLKVPKQYSLLGYNSHSVSASSSGYVPPKLMRALRIGAQDELVNLPSAAPIPSTISQTSPGPEVEDEETVDFRDGSTSPTTKLPVADVMAVDTVAEAAPLVVPAAMFKPINYHPMHIFNPAPGLQVFKPMLPYSEVDEDYHVSPIPQYRQPNRGTSGKPGRRYLERQDVIPGVMTWKRFPCHPLVSMVNNPTLSNIWLPRWTDPFSEDLLPTELPPLLDGLPEDDVVSDDEFDEENGDLIEVPVPTPEMVRAQFPTAESILGDHDQPPAQLSDSKVPSNSKQAAAGAVSSALVSREQREKEVNDFLRQRQNRLGTRIDQRVSSMHELLNNQDLALN